MTITSNFIFPLQYWCTIDHKIIFRLRGWYPVLQATQRILLYIIN